MRWPIIIFGYIISFFFFYFSFLCPFALAYGPFALPIHNNDVEINGGGWYYSSSCSYTTEHGGTDFDAANGVDDDDGDGDADGGITEVYASADGVVEKIDNSCFGETSGWGCYVKIVHDTNGDGGYDYRSMYNHLYDGSIVVSVGDTVTHETFLAYAGDTGASEGAHLDFRIEAYDGLDCDSEIWGGCWIDPYNLYDATSNPNPTCCDLPNGCPTEGSASEHTEFDCSNASDENYLWATCSPVFLEDSTPGFTADGWDSSFSSVVYEAYQRNGGYDVLGDAFDDGGGTYLHEWEDGVYVQNFGVEDDVDEYAILTHADLLDDDTVNPASVIRHAFWYQYSHNDGVNRYGYPLADEMDTAKLSEGTWDIFDPVCDDNGDDSISLSEGQDCVENYCSSSNYESMQRFQNTVFCYESDTEKTTVYESVASSSGGTITIASASSAGSSSSTPTPEGDSSVDCDALAGSGSVTYCTETEGFDDCIQYSNDVCSVKINLAWLDDVNNIQWGAVEDEEDAYVIGQYQIGWQALDANVIYYGVSDPDANCDETGCSTGVTYSSENSIATVTAPGVASYENVLAYRVDETSDCSFYCYAYFDAFEPKLDYDSVYVLNCYNSDDCSTGEYCNKSGSWETWACTATKADGESCSSNEDCQSGYCDTSDSLICFTPSSAEDSDGDGLNDEEEVTYSTDLNDTDSDDDGLSDYFEVISERSDPNASDTDSDGVGDAADLCGSSTSGSTVDENGCAMDQGRSETKLTAPDGFASQMFGGSVALDDDLLLVSAYQSDLSSTADGAVYVYRWDGSAWNEETKLTASDGSDFQYFGSALSVSDDVAVIGARADSETAHAAGAAYVYRWDGSTWNEETKLTASDGAAYNQFGYAVALDGDVAVIGTTDASGWEVNKAYVFRWDGSSWNEETILMPDDGDNGDHFGYAVAMSGDVIIIGAYGEDGTGTDLGVAYVYRYHDSAWYEEAKLTLDDGADGDQFGARVAVDWNTIAISAIGTSSRESVTIFHWNETSWEEEATLTASDTSDTDFGYSFSLDGDLLAVGTLSEAAYVYRWNGATDSSAAWNEVDRLTASDAATNQDFGATLFVDDDHLLIGASGDKSYAGAVYVYDSILNPTIDLDGDGYSETVGDCDDNDASIYVGATEICGDGIDQDCSGADTSCDTDGDGVTDDADTCASTSPLDSSDTVNSSGCALSQLDTDSDGLSDYDETIVYGTDAIVSDTDGDGINDGDEIANSYDPLNVDYVVSKTADTKDGVCDDDCSLREAIIAAKAATTTDSVTINFDIPTTDSGCDIITGVCTISPTSVLPTITRNNMTINGYTQAGASENTLDFPSGINASLMIVIDGISAGATAKGFVITSNNSVIKGIVIQNFTSYGVQISGASASNNKIQGCFIGTDETGLVDQGNGASGVLIYTTSGSGNVIGIDGDGEDEASERNLISGNTQKGIYISKGATTAVAGNVIGMNATLTSSLPNGQDGIYVVSGTQQIGSDVDGTSDDEEGNVIAYNTAKGVLLSTSSTIGTQVRLNSIYNNTSLGIWLAGGANNSKASPVIASKTRDSSVVTVSGTATSGDTIELFVASSDNEGKTYIGTTTTDSGGTWTVTTTSTEVPASTKVVATATDSTNGTSAFSAAYRVR